ncbi:MAG: hypothetical protein LBK99_18095, partial [Opitutaceae bacterium]|nr:hypothetical protein [Opitutaceae bacterium]
MKSEKHIKQNKHIKHNSRQTPAFIVLACALFLSLAVTKPVLADVLASAGFDEGYSLGVVAGQSGASDVGFANGSSWSNHNPVSVIDAVSGNGTDLTYTTPDGGVISSGSHVLYYKAATEQPVALSLRALAAPVTGQD